MGLTRVKYNNVVDTDYKQSVRVITTTGITLAGGAPNAYDSLTLAVGDRILVNAQSTSSQNGIYIVSILGTGSNGTWIRSPDASASAYVTAGMRLMWPRAPMQAQNLDWSHQTLSLSVPQA